MNMTREVSLMLLCARTHLEDDVRERIRACLDDGVDWKRLLALSNTHGVTSLLHQTLRGSFGDRVPAPVLQDLLARCRRIAFRNLTRTQELLRVIKLLESHGVLVLPFKGPVLAADIYRNLSLRQFSDLDVLVQRKDVPCAKAVLAEDGYQPYRKMSPEQELRFIETQMGYEFVKQNRAAVEIHWALLNKVHAFTLETERLWERSTTTYLGGATVRTFSTEDLLLYLCAHGSKSFWARLIWVCDVAELVRARPDLDWDFVLAEADRIRCKRMLFLGLHLAGEFLGVDLPEAVRDGIGNDAGVKSLANIVRCDIIPQERNFPGIRRAHFHLRMRERRRDRLPYYIHLFQIYLLRRGSSDRS
ncbi:MAG TPA: nucleotidyltransferase family protein [Rhodothermales bacterium]|nr:nucleotidyltransferase family protein [Rhodothermales bacterium]